MPPGGSTVCGMSHIKRSPSATTALRIKMDSRRRMLAQFRDLFNGLAPRQRITLVAAPLLVLAGLGLMISRSEGLAEESLLSGKSFGADELEQARLTLHKRGLSQFRVVEQHIVVPRDLASRYNAALMEQAGMPGRFGENWNQALNRKSLLPETDRQRQDQLDIVRAEEIVTMIKQTPQIADARLPPPITRQRSAFGETRRTAILSVTPHDGIALSEDRYRSLRRIVAGAWNMAERDVTVFNTKTGLAYNDAGAIDPHSESTFSRQITSEQGSSQAEITRHGAVPSALPERAPGNDRTPALSNKPTKPRPSLEKARNAETLPPWLPPAGGIMLAFFAMAMLRRTRRRSPQTVESPVQIQAPRSAEISQESPQAATASRQLELTVEEHEVSSPSQSADAHQPLPMREGESMIDRLRPPALPELPSQVLDENPTSPIVPLQFLHEADPDAVLSFVTDEHPQTIALILSHLPAPLAAKVLSGLTSTKQLEVGRRVATLEETSPEVLQDVAKSLKNRIASTLVGPFGKAGSVSTPSQRLSRADRVRNNALLESLQMEDSALAERIRRLMFVFDDLLKLDGSAVASLFARVDSLKWALALKGASEELKSKILDNLSPPMATRLQEELDEVGPVRLSDVAAAQQQIVALVRRLEDSGEIVVDARADVLRMIA